MVPQSVKEPLIQETLNFRKLWITGNPVLQETLCYGKPCIIGNPHYRKPFRKPCITVNPYHRNFQDILYYRKPCITVNLVLQETRCITGNPLLRETLYYRKPCITGTLYYRNPVLQEPLYYRDLFLIQLILGSLSFVGNCSQSQPKELRIGNPNL